MEFKSNLDIQVLLQHCQSSKDVIDCRGGALVVDCHLLEESGLLVNQDHCGWLREVAIELLPEVFLLGLDVLGSDSVAVGVPLALFTTKQQIVKCERVSNCLSID